MPHDAFISYSSLDKAAADATCAALELAGVRCWIAPRDVIPGAEWSASIIDALQASRVLVLVFSENANKSAQVRREVERAVSKGIPVLPLRIQDVPPANALEYFIGTVHWLDALTPPLESHLRRLADSVKSLLQIETEPPRLAAAPPPAPAARRRPVALLAGGACVVLLAAGLGTWWFTRPSSPSVANVVPAVAPPEATTPTAAAPPAAAASALDPALAGTFAYDAMVAEIPMRFVNIISADGTFQFTMTQNEVGHWQAGGGYYRSVADGTGRSVTSSYTVIGVSEVEVTNQGGTADYTRLTPGPALNANNPDLTGTWTAKIANGGLVWALTLQNNPDGTYKYQAVARDHGSCVYANQVWSSTSAVTGRTISGTYHVLDARDIEFTGPTGQSVWQRQ